MVTGKCLSTAILAVTLLVCWIVQMEGRHQHLDHQHSVILLQVCPERPDLQPHGGDEPLDDQKRIQDAGTSTAENSAKHPQ